jgi:hypothetical protein
MERMKARELRKLMESRMVSVEFSEAEVLLLHGAATLADGRGPLTKLFRKRITPVALEILKKRPEYV